MWFCEPDAIMAQGRQKTLLPEKSSGSSETSSVSMGHNSARLNETFMKHEISPEIGMKSVMPFGDMTTDHFNAKSMSRGNYGHSNGVFEAR